MDFPMLIGAKIFGLGMPELIIILVVALVIFGPKNLPKLGASLGKTVKSVREGMDGKDLDEPEVVKAQAVEDDLDDEEEEAPAPKKQSSKKN